MFLLECLSTCPSCSPTLALKDDGDLRMRAIQGGSQLRAWRKPPAELQRGDWLGDFALDERIQVARAGSGANTMLR